MPPSKIVVGKTYCNRGKGTTLRTVLEISTTLRPPWFGNDDPPTNEPVVRYEQGGIERMLYLSSFASWCGREVKAES